MKINNPTLIGQSAGFGVPTGGTAGFVLAKKSSTNYDTEWVAGATSSATYLQVTKSGTQSLTNNAVTGVTGFGTPLVGVNIGEWNGTTGVFTATKSGTYLVNFSIQLNTATYPINSQIAPVLLKNGTQFAGFSWFSQVQNAGFPPSVLVTSMVSLVTGNTLNTGVYQSTAATRTLNDTGTSLTIQELPNRIIR
jgi:hypothetical protein